MRPRMLISLFAFVAAAFICAFRGFFMFREVYDGVVFLHFYLEKLFVCTVFPMIVYLFFLAFSRDVWREKIESFALFMLPFYAVYLPVGILEDAVPLPFFSLFVKPVLFLVMVVAVASESRTLFNVVTGRKKAVALSVFIILVELLLPSLIETLWHYSYSPAIWGSSAFAYIMLCIFRSNLVFKVRNELARG